RHSRTDARARASMAPADGGVATTPPRDPRSAAGRPPSRKINPLLRFAPLLAVRLEGSGWGSRWGGRRLSRRNRDLRAIKSALQRRDTRGDIAFLALFE